MVEKVTPLCPACQCDLGIYSALRDMTGYQLVHCGKCGFTVGAVNYF